MDTLARKIGTAKGYISGVESGRVAPFSFKKIPKLGLVLGLDIEDLAILAWADKAPRIVRMEVQDMVMGWIGSTNKEILRMLETGK